MKEKKLRFNKITSFVKTNQKDDKNMAELQSPQAPDIKSISPEKEADMVHRFRTRLAKKKGRSLLYETE